MISTSNLKKAKDEKPKPLESVSTTNRREEIGKILKARPPKPPGYESGPELKELLTLPDTEKDAKTPKSLEGEALRSPESDDLNKGNRTVKAGLLPWIDSNGKFQGLKGDAYRNLSPELKREYSAAKKAASK